MIRIRTSEYVRTLSVYCLMRLEARCSSKCCSSYGLQPLLQYLEACSCHLSTSRSYIGWSDGGGESSRGIELTSRIPSSEGQAFSESNISCLRWAISLVVYSSLICVCVYLSITRKERGRHVTTLKHTGKEFSKVVH